jgi:CRISPR-associated autoregulator DevR family
MSKKELTHVAGTFLIQADAAFLNGAGLGEGEDRNVTVPKTFRDGRSEVPYVSAQAWKRWLRNTLIEETGWPASEPKAIEWNPGGNVNKIAAELNPIDFAEDDIFGYMRAEAGQGQRTIQEEEESEEGEKTIARRTKSVMRASPFMASLLVSLRPTGWRGQDEGFVHLTKYDPQALAEAEVERFLLAVSDKKQDKKKSVWERLKEVDDDFASKAKLHSDKSELEDLRALLSEKAKERGKEVTFIENPCSPLPYTTRFYNTDLQGIFCLDYSRLGVYWNLGDRIELEEAKAKRLLQEGKIEDVTKEEPYNTLSDNGKIGRVYRITDNVKPTPKERLSALLKALAVLRGGAKQAQFGTDVSPKVLVLAGLSCGNPIFNHLFSDDQEGPIFKTETFTEVIKDYGDRIVTPVFLGIRTGYLKNEENVRELAGSYEIQVTDGLRTITQRGNAEEQGTGSQQKTWTVEVQVTTALEAAESMAKGLP